MSIQGSKTSSKLGEKFPISLSFLSLSRLPPLSGLLALTAFFFPHLYLYTIAVLGESQGPHLLKAFDVSQQKNNISTQLHIQMITKLEEYIGQYQETLEEVSPIIFHTLEDNEFVFGSRLIYFTKP